MGSAVGTPHPGVAVTATMQLFTVHGPAIVGAVARMGIDRVHLRRTPGLRFWKLLGTGDGRTFTVRDADPGTWGLFCVWDGPDASAAFRRSSPTMRGWNRLADEAWTAELRPLRWKGTWSGRVPFEGATPGVDDGGPVAALTRARIRPGRWREFWAAVPPVAAAAGAAPGRRFAVGIGEAPIGLQATFSVWDTTSSLDIFAYGTAAHREVIRRTASSQWYSEEMFARFSVVATSGTVGGVVV